MKGFDFSDVDFSEEQKDDTPFPFRTNPDDPENFDKTGKRPGYQEPTKPLYAFTEERYREQDEASKLTKKKERRKEKR